MVTRQLETRLGTTAREASDAHVKTAARAWLSQAENGSCVDSRMPLPKWPSVLPVNDCEYGERGFWWLANGGRHVSWQNAAVACLNRCAQCSGCHFATLSLMRSVCIWSRKCVREEWGLFRAGPVPQGHHQFSYDMMCRHRDFVMRPDRALLDRAIAPSQSDEVLSQLKAAHKPGFKVVQPQTPGLVRLLGTRHPHPQATALANDGLCARVGEQRAFETRCQGTIKAMNSSLRRLRFRSGLAFTTPSFPKSIWGLGHVLSITYVMHFVCRRLRRYCYLKFYDMDMERLFGYANGESWAPTEEELRQYESTLHLRLPWDPEKIVDRLRNETAPLLHVVLTGYQLPIQGHAWLPHALPLRLDPRRQGQHGLDRCFCRYVSQPLLPPSEKQSRAATAAAVSYHLRTGFADVPDQFLEDNSGAEPSHTAAEQWFKLACDSNVFGERPSFIFSDSPGLLAYLRQAHPTMVSHNQQVANATSPTRSWQAKFEAKIPSATDVVLAGMVPEIEYSYLSSFARPATARSVCTWRAREIERRSCPRFTDVYVRDLYGHISHFEHLKPLCIRKQLSQDHPCKNVSSLACMQTYVEATAAPSATRKAAQQPRRRRRHRASEQHRPPPFFSKTAG